MKCIESKFTLALVMGLMSLSVSAHDVCGSGTSDQRMPEQDVRAKLESQGYKIKHMKFDDCVYEIEAENKSGRAVELEVSALDAKVIDEEDD